MAIQALIVRTAGTNCDQETAHALRKAGAVPSIVHVNRIVEDPKQLDTFDLMIIPGGFSYGDDVAAGKILANELRFKLGDALRQFIERGRRVIGICNGFQVLVKTGLLPSAEGQQQTVTLTNNDSGRFQCHWVKLRREKSACQWLNHTDGDWDLPIAHGEGKFVTQDAPTLAALEKNAQVVFRYQGTNPNGSQNAIAGICNQRGTVLGLMPHPERHISADQHPESKQRASKETKPSGMQFFDAVIRGIR